MIINKDINNILNLIKKEINNNECSYLIEQLEKEISELEDLYYSYENDYESLENDYSKLKEKYNELLETIRDIENQYEKEE